MTQMGYSSRRTEILWGIFCRKKKAKDYNQLWSWTGTDCSVLAMNLKGNR